MTTQKNTSLKGILSIAIISVLFLIVSCDKKQETSKSGVTPPEIDIHTAVVTNNKIVVEQHIKAGSDLNEKDPFGGSSPLISAAVFGKTEMAKLLIDAGADLNFQNKDGSTALHTAAFFCRPEIVQMLLEKGADKTIKNNYGVTAFESVNGPFSESKNTYDVMEKMLGPMGLKLDYAYIEKTRPQIAKVLN